MSYLPCVTDFSGLSALWAQDLREGVEHPTYTPHGVRQSIPSPSVIKGKCTDFILSDMNINTELTSTVPISPSKSGIGGRYDRVKHAVRFSKKSTHYQRPHVSVEGETNCCYISRLWMHKFDTFADPGPVDNHDFLCQHGGESCIFMLLIWLKLLLKFNYF